MEEDFDIVGNNIADMQDARREKKAEFYTQYTDIEDEIKNYKNHFQNKIVYCNCDDPEKSQFYIYFANNFEHLKLKKLICTHYEFESNKTYTLILERDKNKDGKIDKLDTQ
jgi:hypothetical protein